MNGGGNYGGKPDGGCDVTYNDIWWALQVFRQKRLSRLIAVPSETPGFAR